MSAPYNRPLYNQLHLLVGGFTLPGKLFPALLCLSILFSLLTLAPVELYSMQYEIDKGVINTSKPASRDTVWFENNGPSRQTITRAFKETVTHSNKFTHSHGISIKVAASGKSMFSMFSSDKANYFLPGQIN
jgi:hypothetical protein